MLLVGLISSIVIYIGYYFILTVLAYIIRSITKKNVKKKYMWLIDIGWFIWLMFLTNKLLDIVLVVHRLIFG